MPDLTPSQRKRFRAAVASLNRLMDEVKKTIPEANYYLQEDTLILMSGPTHEGIEGEPQYDRELDSQRLYFSGGGGW